MKSRIATESQSPQREEEERIGRWHSSVSSQSERAPRVGSQRRREVA